MIHVIPNREIDLHEESTKNQMKNLQIGSKVTYKTEGNNMGIGTVTGFDLNNNRVFVNWPIHGVSSINIINIEAV